MTGRAGAWPQLPGRRCCRLTTAGRPSTRGQRLWTTRWRRCAGSLPAPAMRRDPRVSPLFAPDLRGLPAAIVITCEHDPLRDQGEAYAQRLRDADVRTTLRREPGMVHNFLLWDLISPACAQAADRVAADLRSAFSALPNDTAPLDRT